MEFHKEAYMTNYNKSRAMSDEPIRSDASLKRMIRRELLRLVKKGVLLRTRRGVRGDPYLYSKNPAHIAYLSSPPDEIDDLTDVPFPTKH
jgi:hypothetical protein